jgi:hypothetical protein
VNNLRDHAWYGTLKKAELRRRAMYQTRYTFASNALAAGEAPSWVAAMLGHTTPEMLFSVYARFTPNRTPERRFRATRPDDHPGASRGSGRELRGRVAVRSPQRKSSLRFKAHRNGSR